MHPPQLPSGGCRPLGVGAGLALALPQLSAAEVAATAATKTLGQTLVQGGLVMIPLGLISVLMVGLILDSALRFTRRRLEPPEVLDALQRHFRAGDYETAWQLCQRRPCLLTHIVGPGLLALPQGAAATEAAMAEALTRELAHYHTRIYYLNLIGVVTPMIGLTGTVLGMIKAFSTLGQSGIGDPTALAGAIGEVLVATASGLFVAIPGFTFYYYFRNRLTACSARAEETINRLFRGMPYAAMAHLRLGQEITCAAPPQPPVPPSP